MVGSDWLGARLGAAPHSGQPHHRRQRPRRARQHRHSRPGQRAEARLRAADERRDQDAVRSRRQPGAVAHQRRAAEGRRVVQAGIRAGPAPRARRQGHRRDRDRRAQSLARARHGVGPAGRQARVRREAGVAHGARRPADDRRRGPLQEAGAGRDDESQPAGGAGGHQVDSRGRPRQDLHGARLVLQAAPADRQVSRWPDGARREVRAHRHLDQLRTDLRRTVPVEGGLRPLARTGAEARPSIATASTTTGTGIGITATATPATRVRTSSTPRGGA